MKAAAAILTLAALLLLAWLLRWQAVPLAWDSRERSRALLLDRWTGRVWLVKPQGLVETVRPPADAPPAER